MREISTGRVSPLTCPQCGSRLAPDDVNVPLMVALCRNCEATVELRPPASPTAPPRELLTLASPPRGITVRESGSELDLSWRWFTSTFQTAFLALWCFVWDGFLVVWYAGGLATLASGDLTAVPMLLFPVLHLAAGVGVTYLLIATVVNSSTIRITDSHLSVQHGPLPWPAPVPIPVRSIDQLYLVQRRGKNQSGYTLVARRSDRTSEEILKGIPDDVQARFLEERIEAHLGIENQPVAGEYNG